MICIFSNVYHKFCTSFIIIRILCVHERNIPILVVWCLMKVNHQGVVVDFNCSYIRIIFPMYISIYYGWVMKILFCKIENLTTYIIWVRYTHPFIHPSICLYICNDLCSMYLPLYIKSMEQWKFTSIVNVLQINIHLKFQSYSNILLFQSLNSSKYTFTYLIRAAGFFASTYFLWIFFIMLFIARIS